MGTVVFIRGDGTDTGNVLYITHKAWCLCNVLYKVNRKTLTNAFQLHNLPKFLSHKYCECNASLWELFQIALGLYFNERHGQENVVRLKWSNHSLSGRRQALTLLAKFSKPIFKNTKIFLERTFTFDLWSLSSPSWSNRGGRESYNRI